jgi:hypothetical protein
MTLPRIIVLAAVLAAAGASTAMAQFPPPPRNDPAFPAPPSPNGTAFPAPPNPNGAAFPAPPNSRPSAFPASRGPAPAAPGPAARAPSSPFPLPGQQPQANNPCEAFLPIRAAAEKDGAAIKTAADRKAPREEVCPLFKRFAISEAKMVKFLKDNQRQCGIPEQAVKQVAVSHNRTIQIRNQVCSTAAAAPTVPRLSDAFGGPLKPDASTHPHTGTFDTLTGNPLRP